MGRRVSITRAARDAQVEIVLPRQAGEEPKRPPVDIYEPPIRKPPIVIALQPLQTMLANGTLADRVGKAEEVCVVVDSGTAVSMGVLSQAASVADADVIVALEDELL